MKKMTKILALLLTLAMILSVGVLSAVQAFAADDVIVIQAGYGNNPGEPTDTAMQKWAELLEERSGGTMKLELFPSSQLGSQEDLTDQIQMGEPIICITDPSWLDRYGAPEAIIAAAPYIYNDWDECWKLQESDWWQEQIDLLAENGIRILTDNWAYGERNLMTTKPVRTLEDLKGLIIRTPSSPIYMKAYEDMGAAPTAMALGDVYTATQQGTIEGMENPLATLYGQAYYEVAKYLTMTSHVKMPIHWITNEDFFQSLTPEQQQWLCETGDEAGEYNNQLQDELAAQYLEDMKAEGVEVIELDEEEFNKFADAAREVYSDPDVTAQWRDGLYDYVREIIES